jgi:hypothetical protein
MFRSVKSRSNKQSKIGRVNRPKLPFFEKLFEMEAKMYKQGILNESVFYSINYNHPHDNDKISAMMMNTSFINSNPEKDTTEVEAKWTKNS